MGVWNIGDMMLCITSLTVKIDIMLTNNTAQSEHVQTKRERERERGPKIHPCGTPQSTFSDTKYQKQTHKKRSATT